MPAPLPSNENDWLLTLRAMRILDTPPEVPFDEVTRLAAKLCGTPIALVSLLDDGRQWFKSRVGVEVAETPRELAFCAHAILGTEPLVVPDATRDDRFASNPLVTGGPGIRFYAGVPLVVDEMSLGTLCVIDTRPRVPEGPMLEILRVLGAQVSMLLRDRLASTRLAVINATLVRQAEELLLQRDELLAERARWEEEAQSRIHHESARAAALAASVRELVERCGAGSGGGRDAAGRDIGRRVLVDLDDLLRAGFGAASADARAAA